MKKGFLLSLLGLMSGVSMAQLIVQPMSPDTMVNDFFQNSCITVSEISYIGQPGLSNGYFDASNTNLGINGGILLTTGTIQNALGPNNGASLGTNLSQPGDSTLFNDLAGISYSYDANVLQFKFTSTEDTIKFKYVFASEEYPEFVCNGFNDAFAFYIAEDADSLVWHNIALVPGTPYVVSIDRVNEGNPSCTSQTFPQYYVDGLGNIDIQYDGRTVPMWATTVVTPGANYRAKIVIMDVGDGNLDSGVFIGSESLCGSTMITPVADAIFQETGNTVSFQNRSRYGTSYLWNFGDGTTSTDFSPSHTFNDLVHNGYDVTLTATNYCCSNVQTFRVGQALATESVFAQVASAQPNPANGQLNVQLKEGQEAAAFLTDMTGKTLWNGTIQGKATIHLAAFGTGMFILHLNSGGKWYQQKILNN